MTKTYFIRWAEKFPSGEPVMTDVKSVIVKLADIKHYCDRIDKQTNYGVHFITINVL
jgi:hypothetical protein